MGGTRYRALVVIGLAAGLRLQWFGVNEALWADEAVYLLGAQGFAGLADYQLHASRPPALPWLWATLAGWIAALLLAVFSSHLFLTERVLTDVPALSLWLWVLLLFWRGFVRNDSPGAALLLGPAFAALLLARFAYVLLLPVLAVMLLATSGPSILRDRRLWISVGLGALVLVPYLLWSWIEYGSPAAAWTLRAQAVSPTYAARVADVYASGLRAYLELIPARLLDWVLVALIFAGVSLAVRDRFAPTAEADSRRDLLVLLWGVGALLMIPLSGHNEPRFLLPVFPAAFLLIGHVLERLHASLAPRSRVAAAIAILVLLAWPVAEQVRRAQEFIERNAGSFRIRRVVGEWVGANTPAGAWIHSAEPAITEYYSGRRSRWYPETAQEFDERPARADGEFALVFPASRYQPDWLVPWIRARAIEPARVWTPRGVDRPVALAYELPSPARAD
jgi:hypothetical protein